MPEITGALDAIITSTACDDKGGIRVLYWTEYDNIDWDTMLGDVAEFTPATGLILGYSMVGGAVFNKVEFERKEAFYDFTYTSDADVVALLMTLAFKGKNNDRKNSLDKAIRSCAIVCHVYGENGIQRVIGVDYNGVAFSKIPSYLEIGRVLDSSGQRGTSKARDEMDIIGEADFLPMYATVDEANIPV